MVEESETFELLQSVYHELGRGIRFTDQTHTLKRLVNFGTSTQWPVHGWYYFKEGFSPRLVELMLERHLSSGDDRPTVLDPFCGSGTTVLACQLAGVDSIGVEHNPFFVFLGRAKIHWHRYDPEKLEPLIQALLASRGEPTIAAPELSSFQRLFPPENLRDLLLMKERIQQVEDGLARQFLLVGLAAILERVSLARKEGKGLKFSRNPRRRVLGVREALARKWGQMLDDLRRMRAFWDGSRDYDSLRAEIHRGDARDLARIEDGAVDLIVYSPPYLNSFDYTEVYKLELWLLDFVRTAEEFRDLRASALRSHLSVPPPRTDYLSYRPLEILVEAVSQRELWNKRIPDMIRGYFDDMYLALREQARVLKRGAILVCVVANSSYARVPIPTDLLIARIGEMVGLRAREIQIARRMNTSSQQLARYGALRQAVGELVEPQGIVLRSYLRESAVILEKV